MQQQSSSNAAQGLWFKSRRFGWGWTPITWQGWLVTFIYIASLLGGQFIMLRLWGDDPNAKDLTWLFAFFVLATGVLIWMCYTHGEKPRWRGFK